MSFTALPRALVRRARQLNARLIPQETYRTAAALALSALEEAYFVAKNFVDTTLLISGQVLYEDGYHEERLAEYGAQKRLVVFVPGYMQTRIGFYRLESLLGLPLFDAFTYTFAGFPYSQDIRLTAEQLAEVLRDLVDRTGVKDVFLVGHSQGGIIIRAMLQLGMARGIPVRKCLFMNSPHQGTWIALGAIPHGPLRAVLGKLPYVRRVKGESGLQLLPGSELLELLNSRPLPNHIQFASIHYAFDPIVVPPSHAILPYPGVSNHFVPKVGHTQPLYCSRAARIAIEFLYGQEGADHTSTRAEWDRRKSGDRRKLIRRRSDN